MLISVVLPTYKPSSYLWECLDSLQQQSFDKDQFEVIIVLNGCKEPYYSQIINYINSESNNNLTLIHVDEGGVSNARNIGIENSNGEYITFIDDDDYVSKDYLEALFTAASKYGVSISDAVSFDDRTRVVNYNYPAHISYKKYHKNKINSIFKLRKHFSSPWGILYHKNVLRSCRFDKNFTIGEDVLFCFETSSHIKYINFAGEGAVYYRRYRENSLMTSNNAFYIIRKNIIKWNFACDRIFWRNPMSYNFLFYITRKLGSIHSLLTYMK